MPEKPEENEEALRGSNPCCFESIEFSPSLLAGDPTEFVKRPVLWHREKCRAWQAAYAKPPSLY